MNIGKVFMISIEWRKDLRKEFTENRKRKEK